MDIDYLESLLNSNSTYSHAKAAVSLRFRMVDGVHLLPSLLKVCKAVETPLRKELTRPEKYLLGFGAMTMGEFIGNKGYCKANPLHSEIVQWVIELTRSLNTEVAFYAINAIRLCNTPLHEATDRLVKMIEMEKRDDEHEIVSLRAYALRALHSLDASMSEQFVHHPAWNELKDSVSYWRLSHPNLDFEEDFSWLQ